MNWRHVNLIYMRELTDQLRDRRTVFTITVLPLLLYPLIGMLMMQVAQFNKRQAANVRIVGLDNWPSELPLLDKRNKPILHPGMIDVSEWMNFESQPWPTIDGEFSWEQMLTAARTDIASDKIDAVLFVEPGFEQELRSRLTVAAAGTTGSGSAILNDADSAGITPLSTQESVVEHVGVKPSSDGLQVIANLARDNSRIAQERIGVLLDSWRAAWVSSQLASAGMSPRLIEPFTVDATDTATESVKSAVLWTKILPMVMLVWALTGAFYPAIDLCAGEKERGTLETLLSSPARRAEIVWGKLFTVITFSVSSAVLNLLSMHFTASFVVRKLLLSGIPDLAETLGPLPIQAVGWLLLLLLPMAAFFSALALAIAALARSTKEGQYYLMPLLLVTLPLVSLPMLPSMSLNLGTSLIPVTGTVFLIRSLIEGRYFEAFIYLPTVVLVTACCCGLSIRWAIKQFESETVMFRESERWNLKLLLHHLWRDREDTASTASALLAGAIILVSIFFAQLAAGSFVSGWSGIASSTFIVQVLLILTPCLLMSVYLTRSPRRALRIHRVQFSHVIAALGLGVAVHPTYSALGYAIQQLYEIGPETQQLLAKFQHMVGSQPLWAVLMILAALPALCEELAFRGFIFGGLLRSGGALRAIVVTSLLFGFAHPVLQQSIAAALMGLFLGLIAWRTGGVICTIVVHLINNTLSVSMAWMAMNHFEPPAALSWAVYSQDSSWTYTPTWSTLSVLLALTLTFILMRRDTQTQRTVQAEMA
ncbi:MAG: CPBP family intramembrane metalloprotease [Planctomycetales bacterium]|nr:CPBP family intramembrane metalloprotease [Planctomycetales bacterium]